jgi:flagellar hook-associated protein 1 FlgK
VAAGRTGGEALDRRDAAIARLSEMLDVTPVAGDRGGVKLILRGGALLSLDPDASPLALDGTTVGPGPMVLPGLTLNGAPLSSVLRGGRIGAGLDLRDNTLVRMAAEVDTLAATVATRLGEQGLTLFTEPGGGLPPAPGSAAAAGFATRISVSPEVQSDPRNLRDGTTDVPAFPPNPDGRSGYTALLDRVLGFAFGDRRDAGTDHPPIAGSHAGPLGPLNSTFAPPRRIADFAAALSAAQASEIGATNARAEEASAVSARLAGLVQSREGVDIDAEMSAMVALQNAYAANARVMTAVQGMWDALLGTVR